MFQDNQPQQPQAPQEPEAPQAPATPEPPTAPIPESQQASQTPAPQPTPKKPGTPAPIPEKTTQEERMWAAIGYIAFLGVVSLAIKPKSAFCKHHAANGLTIFIFWFISLILLAIIPEIGGILWLGFSGLAVFGIVKSIQSYKMELPVLSSIAKKIPTDKIIGTVTGKTPEPVKPAEGTKATSAEVKPVDSSAPPVQESAEPKPEVKTETPEMPVQEAPKPQEPTQNEQGDANTPPQTPPQA